MKKLLILILSLALAVMMFSCGSNKKGDSKAQKSSQGGTKLTAAGASFPYPLYDKMFKNYSQQNDIQINYRPIGSGGGIRQIKNKIVDFAGTDAFIKDKQMKNVDGNILHIPTCIGAVVVSYNVDIGNASLKLTSDVLADIFLGNITKWNDPAIKKINPKADLPDQEITVVHRADGSGTTFIFSDYLSKVSNEWRTKVGAGKSLSWPVGLGGKANAGVAGLIKQQPGSIGYVEYIYAKQNNLPVSVIQNKSGNYVSPSVKSCSKAAEIDIPKDTRVTITNTDAPQGYPITSFTWLVLYKEQNYGSNTLKKTQAKLDLLWWMIHDGQKYTKQLDYAPLPENAIKRAEKILKSVTFDGKKVLEK